MHSPVSAPTSMNSARQEYLESFQNHWFKSDVYGACQVEFYKDKSYIRNLVDGKFKQIIGSCDAEFHKQIVNGLIDHVINGKCKEELLEARNQIHCNLKDVD